MASPTRYAKAADVHVAYQVHGAGDLKALLTPGFISHLEYQLQEPNVERFTSRLFSFLHAAIFDKRGTGLSDPVPSAPTLEERVDDMRAVLDAVGFGRAALIGWSEGGPMDLLFAAMYPERVTHLVLFGSYARFAWAPDYPIGVSAQQFARFMSIADRWGDGVALGAFAPSLADNAQAREWWARLQRHSLTPGMLRSLFLLYPQIDVRAVLPSIRVPTLVMHRRGDKVVSVEHGRYLAEHIRDARYVELDGDDHLIHAGDQEAVLEEIEEFLTGVRHAAGAERVLCTLLFTDIVGSTELAQRLGDDRWRSVLAQHEAIVRRHLQRFRGTEIDTAGDGFFASFDGPARAVQCGAAIRDAMRQIGVEIRVGVHTGECERHAGKLAGVAVHLAARLSADAAPGEVLVSGTVRDLVAGSGLVFTGGDSRRLKGLSDAWRVYRLEAARA